MYLCRTDRTSVSKRCKGLSGLLGLCLIDCHKTAKSTNARFVSQSERNARLLEQRISALVPYLPKALARGLPNASHKLSCHRVRRVPEFPNSIWVCLNRDHSKWLVPRWYPIKPSKSTFQVEIQGKLTEGETDHSEINLTLLPRMESYFLENCDPYISVAKSANPCYKFSTFSGLIRRTY